MTNVSKQVSSDRRPRVWPVLAAVWWGILIVVVIAVLSLSGCGSVELVTLDGGAALSDPVSSPDGAAEHATVDARRAETLASTSDAGLDVGRADRIDTKTGDPVQDAGAEAIPGCTPGGLYEGPAGLTPCP